MRCARCNGELVAEGHYWGFSTEEREIKRYTSCRLQARTTPEAQYNTFVIVEVYCSNCFHHLMPKEKREYIKEGNVKIAENSELYSEDEAKDAAKHLIYRQQSFRDAKKHTKKCY